MDELLDNPFDLSELILLLQHEKQLVYSERKQIQDLNQGLNTKVEQLLKSGWINFQQRLNLNALVGSRPDCTPEQCCRKATSLENSIFIQAKEVFDYQVTVNFSHFLSWLRSRPELIAQLVVIGEALSTDQRAFNKFLNSIVSGLYGSIVLPQDTGLMLTLLQNLAQLQLAATDNPRRLLKTQSCAFSKMYFLFHEGLVSAKLFLIAALQNPIIKLIARSSNYLDVDPAKILSRLTLSERLEKFGTEGSEIYGVKLAAHRKSVIKSLAELTHLFISSLHDNIYCFPSTLTWLIRKVAKMISKSFNPHSKEINAICTDLIFTLFICPAIVQPEPYGICDAPISEIARHNLIQVGQILQMLALMKFESPEVKLLDLYGMFQADCVSNILDIIMGNYGDLIDEMPVDKVQGIERNIALFTEDELYELVSFLKRVHTSTMDQGNTGNEAASVDFCSNNANYLPNDTLQILLSKLPSDNEGSPRNTFVNNNNISPTNASKKTQLLNKAKTHLSRVSNNGDCEELPRNTTVLIIPLNSENEEHIGLLSEEKVLSMHVNVDQDLLIDVTDAPIIDPPELVNGGLTSGQEKRTRFSLNDEGSIGNTSDNLEVISEAASNHSVASSIELENEDQNDNLSDMVSANVSGRGTPNISGRDTPSSQVTENEDNRANPEVRQPYLQQPQLVSKQIRSEIDDKFCKFEIKKLLEGDETISIISDTWSTDVLASDSETIDANDGRHEQSFTPIISNPLLDVSETQSESAWSTDVLASDTERMTEVDNDDVASVAPSDDTASVARSDDAASVAPSELDENLNDRRLSTASSTNHFVTFQASQNSPSAFQEYRRLEIGNRRESMPNYSLSKQEMHSETQTSSFERVVYNMNDTQLLRAASRSCSDSSKREAMLIDQKCDFKEMRSVLVDISNNVDSPGSSGLNKPETSYILVKNVEQNKYDDIKTDMQLSNTSLNSSSSGSSLENKPAGSSWKNKESWNGSETNLNVTSTPLENKKVAPKSKPSISTGAIPKSISFDMSAEKGDKDVEDDQKSKRGGFFGKLRMNFRPRRGKSFRGSDESSSSRVENCDDENKFRRPYDYISNGKNNTPLISLADTSDDILAKYRKPVQNGPVKAEKIANIEDVQLMISEGVDSNLLFKDVKKKLRLVLSNARSQHFLIKKGNKAHIKKDLESFLQLELAKARDLKNYMIAARVAEALRCVRLLDIATFNKLCDSLKEEYYDRSIYIKYLLKSKQALLLSQAYLDELLDQVERDKDLCATFLVAVCVRFFLERHERDVQTFCEEFQRFTLVDEQNHHLNLFLTNFFIILRKDQLWQDSSDEQIHMAKEAVERAVMTQVYFQALYPNGDGDRHRDSVLSEHLKKLASTISPGNKYLLINKMYHNECPWLPAQEALQAMAAYRTPRDKVQCIIRCTCAIMDLLSLAQRNSTAADDLIPVLVYVIIEANPQDLLSTIQYVNSFYGNLSGEDRYYWTQFCSAVEYTKTMEYND